MTNRRLLLGAGLALLVASAAQPTRAATTKGEVEGAAYGGTTAGGWVCGPVGRANYAGVGARVRFDEREAKKHQGSGWSATVGGGAEAESVEIIKCRDDPCTAEDEVAPPNTTLVGAQAKGGYHWQHFGVEGGAMAYSGWDDNTDRSPGWAALPVVELSAGRRDKTHVVAGLGSPLVTTMRRPGGYLGANIKAGDSVEIDARAGAYRVGPGLSEDIGPRGDVVVRIPVGSEVTVNVGASVSNSDDGGLGAEGGLGASAGF